MNEAGPIEPGTDRSRNAGRVLGAALVLAWPPPALSAGPAGGVCAPEPPRFVAEVVHLEISTPELIVEGRYWILGGSVPGSFALLYPFVRDSLSGPPRLLDADVPMADGTRVALPLWDDAAGWHTLLQLSPGDTCQVHIRYAQRLASRRAGYRLLSTRDWGRPLSHARLEVDLPSTWSPGFSLPFREVASSGSRRRFVLEAADFFPERDLWVTWQPAPPRRSRRPRTPSSRRRRAR